MTRPTSLTIIGWLLIVFALFGIFGQLTLTSNPVAQEMLAQSKFPTSVHLAMGWIGVLVSAASGYGVLKGLNWSRFLYIGWSVISFVFSLLSFPFTTVMLLSVVVIAVFAFFLFRPAANAWFAQGGTTLSE